MATLVITPGAANANSYADATFAKAYFADTIRNAQWKAFPEVVEDGGTVLLLEAMRFIEAQRYVGERVDDPDPQALNFPRWGGPTLQPWQWPATDKLRDMRGREWAIDAIPTPVKQAQCEMAFAIGQNRRWLDDRYKREKINVAAAEIEVANAKELGTLCKAARLLLQPFLLRGRQGATTR